MSRRQKTNWAGMEVPVIGLDSLQWREVHLPPPDSSYVSPSSSSPIAPLTGDAASCFAIGGTYLVWRIHKDQPHALELLELNADRELPRNGLRIIFPIPLCPFLFICKDEISCTPGNPYLMHALTITGVAYLFKLRSLSTYKSHTVISKFDFVEFNLQTYPNIGRITAVAATPGHLLVGKMDGSVSIFQLGMDDRTAPGFLQELRAEAVGRLWGLMSSYRTPEGVQDLVIRELNGRKIVFVLHINCILQAWDLSSHCRIFCNTMSDSSLSAISVKVWVAEVYSVAEVDSDTRMIQLSILYKHKVLSTKPLKIFYLDYKVGDSIKLSLNPSCRTIPFEKAEIIDMKLTPKKIWVLTKDGIVLIHLLSRFFAREEPEFFVSHGSFVADQLLQNHGHHWDDLPTIIHSIFSSAKDQIVPFVSSMLLRRLLQPGVYYDIVFRATMQDYKKHWSDSDFESLTVDQIKKEIISLIAHEAGSESLTSIIYGWKHFFTRYLHHWVKSSALFGVFVDTSTGAICLIRKHSLSFFRRLKDIEQYNYVTLEKAGAIALSLVREMVQDRALYEILLCANNLSQHLGSTALAIYYESQVQTTSSSEEIISLLVKMLETGHSSSPSAPKAADNDWDKKLTHHKTQRKFALDMILSLRALCNHRIFNITWSIVLNAIESYVDFLAPQKTFQKFDSEVLFKINPSICIQSTTQVAKMMFESAFNLLLLLHYLTTNSAQIDMSHPEVSRIQCELVPRIQEVLTEWLIVHFIGTTPSQCPALEDLSPQLSLLQIALQNDVLLPMPRTYVGIEKLENEYLLTSAANMLSLANVKWTYSAAGKHILELLELLVQKHLYDMAFTVILSFCKGSRMKREMERVFQAMALECVTDSKLLELYLDRYKSDHASLPVIVAESLLRTDSQIQLPLWLVQMFENGPTESYRGMADQESSPASLLRIYIDYGRYIEATSMVLKYMKMFTDVSPHKLIHRKKALAVWFPRTLIERLLCQLEKSISSGHNMEKYGKLKQLLHEALVRYLALNGPSEVYRGMAGHELSPT